MSFSSGGGSGSIQSGSDVALSNPTTGQLLGYNASISKWTNVTPSSGTGGPSPYSALIYQRNGSTYAVDRFGTVIDSGTTSSTVNRRVINAAISQFASAPNANNYVAGAVVFITAGVYAIDQAIVCGYGVNLLGEGGSNDGFGSNPYTLYGTVILPDAGVTPGIQVGAASGSTSVKVTTNPHAIWIKNIGISGHNNASGVGVQVTDTQSVKIIECAFADFSSAGTGVYQSGNVTFATANTWGLDLAVMNCMFKNCANGVYADSYQTDGYVYDCRFISCGTYGIYIREGGWVIRGNHITSTQAVRQLLVNGGSPCIITNNYFDSGGNSSYQVELKAPIATVTGNFFYPSVANITACLKLTYDKVTVSNNIFGRNGSGTYKAFIELSSGSAANAYITGNTGLNGAAAWVNEIIGASGSAIADQDTATTYIHGNLSW